MFLFPLPHFYLLYSFLLLLLALTTPHCSLPSQIEACAYAGSGDVLVLQHLLDACTEEGKEVAALGVALVAIGEKIGTEMTLRHFQRMMQVGSVNLRRWVALGLGVLSCGQPMMGALPFLPRMTHDHSKAVSFSALIGLGLMAAGTNNGATAKLFRELSDYHAQDAQLLFIVRIGQALTHLGKGLLTVNPLQFDDFIVSRPSLVGLISFCYVAAYCKERLECYSYSLPLYSLPSSLLFLSSLSLLLSSSLFFSSHSFL